MAKSKSKSGKAESKASKVTNSSGKKTVLPQKTEATAKKSSSKAKTDAKKIPSAIKAAPTKAPVKKTAPIKTIAPAKKTAKVQKEAPKKTIVAKEPVLKSKEKGSIAKAKNAPIAKTEAPKGKNGIKSSGVNPSNNGIQKLQAPASKETPQPLAKKASPSDVKKTAPDIKKIAGKGPKPAPTPRPRPTPASVNAAKASAQDRKNFEERVMFKRDILNRCIELQAGVINTAKRAMDEAQESANEEKGSTEEKFDSFRESMQITRDMHARQLQEAIDGLALLKRIVIVPLADTVKLGAVVHTNLQNYFISASLGELEYDENNYMAVSTQTPIYLALAGKRKGDTFVFRDQKYRILEVF